MEVTWGLTTGHTYRAPALKGDAGEEESHLTYPGRDYSGQVQWT